MNKRRKYSLIIAFAIMLAGLFTYGYQLREGLIVTDMSNLFPWGLYVSALAFFVGNAAGGLVLSASVYMFGITKLKPFAKIGALTAFANVTAAMLIVIPDIGQPLRLWHILRYPQFSSPLAWDVFVLSAYAVLTIVYLYILMLPDLKGPGMKELSEKLAKRIAPIALVFAIGIHVVTAWIFSTQMGREWWFTAALAPDFLAVAVFVGTTVVLMASVLLYGIKDQYKEGYSILVKIITAMFFVHLFLMYNDFFIKAWYGAESATHVFNILMDSIVIHIFEVLAPLLAIILLNSKVRNSVSGVVVSGVILMAGVFAHRFLIMPPAFNAIPLTIKPLGLIDTYWSYPIATGRYVEGVSTIADYWNYSPTWVEFTLLSGVIAYMYFVVALGVSILPVKKED
ncbi:MAG: NrfD/PsrC family molybdoenzyme membrane anchor subunit [Candidatus Methanoperedens sp.]|nr:NrfD/PsrC family molybdoenzyme membrane anchor subunit [Candidatus Methanoperedens sp.]